MNDHFLQALEDRRMKREAERNAMIKRSAVLNAEAEADTVAKRVYLETLTARPVPDAIELAPPPHVYAAKSADTDKLMVKEMILAVLRDAYPNGMTAEQIKGKAFLRFKQHINPNTLTVSLGRYSKPKEGEPRLARCEGRTWFYIRDTDTVPPRAPELALLNGGRHAAE